MGGKVLKTHPKTVHFRHVLENEFDRVIDIATLALILVTFVWQDIFHHLQQIVPEEETSGWLLDSLDHIK